jgi:hypothetical protein
VRRSSAEATIGASMLQYEGLEWCGKECGARGNGSDA